MAGQNTAILALDYNNIQSSIAQVLGTGSGNYGYCQTVLSSQVSQNAKITAVQWQNLYTDLIAARTHQTGVDETANLTYPNTSTTIKESDRAAYNAYAATINAHRLDTPASTQRTAETYTTGTRTAQWNGTVTHSSTITFANTNTARAFFNAGGYIQISAGMSPDVSNLKNNSWQTMLANMGNIILTYATVSNTGSATGVTLAGGGNFGFYSLTTTPTLLFQKLTETAFYSPNQYDIYASTNASQTQIILSIQFADLSTAASENPSNIYEIDENVSGTLISTIAGLRPTGNYVSVAQPSATSSGP